MSIDIAAYPFCDFPTVWAICRSGIGHADPRCSYVQTGGAILCDCEAVEAAWTRLRKDAGLEHDRYRDLLVSRGLWPFDRRPDGWPLCPVCGEDELAVLEFPPPPTYTWTLDEYLAHEMFCYRVGRITIPADPARL